LIDLKNIAHVYFIGIGGIGMSALARYFQASGKKVTGYDKTPSVITQELTALGIEMHYEDYGNDILNLVTTKETTLVVYTPAVPNSFG
jgi:UDP-N-acetylmuramate--alanine ligase